MKLSRILHFIALATMIQPTGHSSETVDLPIQLPGNGGAVKPGLVSGPMPLDEKMGEYLVDGEADASEVLVGLFSDHMKNQYESKNREALRAVHSKDHGCLTNAKFEVFAHREADLKFSIFQEPKTYDAFIRISNGDGPPVKDTDKMVSIGFALKVLNVPSKKLLPGQQENSQDFLFINQAAFLVKDIVDFSELIKAREGGILQQAKFAATHPDAVIYRRSASPKDDPLNTPYWSGLPFKLGKTAVKYMIRPCAMKEKQTGYTDDFLKDLVKRHIEKEDACFDFYIQKRLLNGREKKEMPIENARTIWSEVDSKPIRIAKITIPKQSMSDSEKSDICDRAQFSPWNTTEDFRPLGNLNRVRKLIYEFSASERHKINRTENPFH